MALKGKKDNNFLFLALFVFIQFVVAIKAVIAVYIVVSCTRLSI
jgi:hypothetical protein